jgi:hypothetical protein
LIEIFPTTDIVPIQGKSQNHDDQSQIMQPLITDHRIVHRRILDIDAIVSSVIDGIPDWQAPDNVPWK